MKIFKATIISKDDDGSEDRYTMDFPKGVFFRDEDVEEFREEIKKLFDNHVVLYTETVRVKFNDEGDD